jgi:PKD repeat protein
MPASTGLAAALLLACGDDGGPSNVSPTARFTAECELLECSFSNSSADADGTVEAYSWDFGDESPVAITEHAAHRYAVAGRFRVALTVTDDDGETATATDSVDVREPDPGPTASFTYTCAGLTCEFVDRSPAYAGAAYHWDFGDGSPQATTRDAQHTYPAAGRYLVRLSLTGAAGTASATAPVDVVQSNGWPLAEFSVSCVELTCTFTNHSLDDGELVSYAWSFGDGQTSAVRDPSHAYAAPGNYIVELTVTDDHGATASAAREIPVPPPPPPVTAAFSFACSSLQCTFTNESSSGFIAYWDFGDGTTSEDWSPWHRYSVDRMTTFTVTLMVYDWDLFIATASAEVTVAP